MRRRGAPGASTLLLGLALLSPWGAPPTSTSSSSSTAATATGIGLAAAWSAEHGACELCIYSVHQVQYGSLPSCGGTTKTFSYSACSQVVQSMLAYAHDVMHLISYGCYQYDPYRGWQTVKPCPAHVVCGRLPNIYEENHETMCPTDFHYRFPHALSALAPKTFNPLLPYAVSQYRNDMKSSIMDEEGAPASEPMTQVGGMNGGMAAGGLGSAAGPESVRFKSRNVELRGSSTDANSNYPATAFPSPLQSSGLPSNIYTQKTNPMLAAAAPGSVQTLSPSMPAGQRSFGASTLANAAVGPTNQAMGHAGPTSVTSLLEQARSGQAAQQVLQQHQQPQKNHAVVVGQRQAGVSAAGRERRPSSLLDGVKLPFAPPQGGMRGR
jgi:hypothetical protein